MMNNNKAKNSQAAARNRAANYHETEIDLIVSCMGPYSGIIENKDSDTRVWETKTEVWIKIAEDFNKRNTLKVMRTADQLKKKYEAMKAAIKIKCGKHRQYAYGTGGGRWMPPLLTPTEEKIKDFLSTTLEGLPSQYDPDYVPEIDMPVSQDQEEEFSDFTSEVTDGTPELSMWSGRYCPADLKTPVNPVLKKSSKPTLIIVPGSASEQLEKTAFVDESFILQHTTSETPASVGNSQVPIIDTPLKSKPTSLIRKPSLPNKGVKRDIASTKIAEYCESRLEITKKLQKSTEEELPLKKQMMELDIKIKKERHEQEQRHREERHQIEMEILKAELTRKKNANPEMS